MSFKEYKRDTQERVHGMIKCASIKYDEIYKGCSINALGMLKCCLGIQEYTRDVQRITMKDLTDIKKYSRDS